MSVRFSICIPNYNYEKFIGETIRSVLDQDHADFEIVVTDNCSTDRSVEIVKSFNDPRIKLFQNPTNLGFAANIQACTSRAQNEYILVLSSDDKMRPGALSSYAGIIEKNPGKKLVLFSDVAIINESGKIIGSVSRSISDFKSQYHFKGVELTPGDGSFKQFSGHDILKKTLPGLNNFAPFLAVCYSRALYNKIGGYYGSRTIGPDKFFHFKLLEQNPQVFYAKSKLFEYRIHGSVNTMAQRQNIKQQIDDYLYTLEYDDAFLNSLGLNKKSLVHSFIDDVCLRTGFSDLAQGRYRHAWQMLFFALAAYPVRTLKRGKSYLLWLLLLTGPFSVPLARLIRRLRNTLRR